MPSTHTPLERDAMEHAAKALRRLRKRAPGPHPSGMAPYSQSPTADKVDETAYAGRLIELYMGRGAPKRMAEDAFDPLSVMAGRAMQMAEKA